MFLGQTLNNISPSDFTFKASKMVKVNIPVKVATKGFPSKSVKIEEIKAQPSSINLLVHSDRQTHIKEIYTEPLKLENIHQNSTEKLKLNLPSGAQFFEENNDWVKVDIKASLKQDNY